MFARPVVVAADDLPGVVDAVRGRAVDGARDVDGAEHAGVVEEPVLARRVGVVADDLPGGVDAERERLGRAWVVDRGEAVLRAGGRRGQEQAGGEDERERAERGGHGRRGWARGDGSTTKAGAPGGVAWRATRYHRSALASMRRRVEDHGVWLRRTPAVRPACRRASERST